ncbi:uncharacterized protein LOC119574097, partial [Penaeus monodon]|uniref:uncharacterized protein LOC119574097 n=1 Tax=Penaeus monodon TaxID=6687 RepID=UPI0018A7B6E4
LSKQNTYVLQNGRGGSKHPERRAESDLGGYKSSSINNSINSNRSVENLEYSRVADDISPIPETEEDVSESHYAEICDYGQRARRQPFARGHPPLSLPNLSFTLEEENHVPSDASGRLSATFSESRSRKFSSASGDYKENIPAERERRLHHPRQRRRRQPRRADELDQGGRRDMIERRTRPTKCTSFEWW